MREHVNKNFISSITGKHLLNETDKRSVLKKEKEAAEILRLQQVKIQEELNKQRFIAAHYEKLRTPYNPSLNKQFAKSLNESLSRHFSRLPKHLHEQVTSPSDWVPQNTPVGIFYVNKTTGEWMNSFGHVALSLEDLLHATGEDMNSDVSQRSLTAQTIEDPILPAATSILDYEIWSTTFYNVPTWNTESYTTFAIVPSIFLITNQYNGYRNIGNTSASDWTTGLRNTFVSLASSIPESRRVCLVYAYFDEMVPFSWNKTAYYANTLDGVTYGNRRFLTPWMDTMYSDHKDHFKTVLQYLDSNNITIPYFQDDKESAAPIFGLDGLALYYGQSSFDASGNPTAIWANTGYGGIYYYDARITASYMHDSRFTGLTNPQSNQTLSASIVDIYNSIPGNTPFTGRAPELMSRAYGVTLPGDFVAYGFYNERPYSYYGPGPAVTESQRRNDISIKRSHLSAMNELIQGNYASRVFYDTFDEVPRFNSSIYSDYEEAPISPEESIYYQDSNDEPLIIREYPNMSGGHAWYANAGNIIRPFSPMFPGSPTYISGYVRNPQTNDERYNFKGHQNPSYVPSPGATLVRYANQTSSSTQVQRELAYKQFVWDLKTLRLQYRSKPDFWSVHAPWLWLDSYNGYYNSSYDSGRYGAEFVYHLILHGVLYLTDFGNGYDGGSRTIYQNILNKWRDISYNSNSRPCSNATGDVDELVDRLVLADAFDNVAMSGGRLTRTGKYLWRITAPPSAIRSNGTIVFQRVGTDSDIPATVTCSPTDPYDGRGIWIKRLVSTPPQYVTVPE
jgi:hypothetical protein